MGIDFVGPIDIDVNRINGVESTSGIFNFAEQIGRACDVGMPRIAALRPDALARGHE